VGYKTPVRTSQETNYVSITESSQLMLLRFEVFTAVTMINAIFWDVTPCGSCKNRHFRGCITSITRVTRISKLETTFAVVYHHSVFQLLLTTNVVPSSPILVTLMTEAMHSSEMLVLTSATRHDIPDDGILQCILTIHDFLSVYFIYRIGCVEVMYFTLLMWATVWTEESKYWHTSYYVV
jgi:hypothetical protein